MLTVDDFHGLPLIEGIVTTSGAGGATNIAPMGPRVDWPTTKLLLRPYQSSTTYENLRRSGRGIFHVTDDVLLIARAAIDRLPAGTPLAAGPEGYGERLADAVRWYAFDVVSIDDSQDRTEIVCQVAHQGHVRDFFGFHRARHAVLEAAILATRLHLLPIESVLDQYADYAEIIDKTAGPDERIAFAELQQFISNQLGEAETKTVAGR